MTKKTYYIFRHSETIVTQSKRKIRGYGWKIFSAHILPIGHPVTEKLGAYFKDIPTDKNICSQYLRCKETAEIVSRISGKKFTYDKRLNEFFLETFWHFKRRLKRFIQEMEQSDAETILICTHAICIFGLVRLLTGEHFSLKHIFGTFPPPGNLTIIKGKKVTSIDFNTKTV